MEDVWEKGQMSPKENKVKGRRREVKEQGKRERVNGKAKEGKGK